MLRPITASIFALAFLVQTFSGQFIRLDYYLNTAAFVKHCENKATPKMHCNGKCQMMKKMQQEEKNDQQSSQRKSGNKDEVLSSRSFFCSIDIRSGSIELNYPHKLSSSPINRSIKIFHPPQDIPAIIV